MMFSSINLINVVIFMECAVMAQLLGTFMKKRNHYLLRLIISTTVFGTCAFLIPFHYTESFWEAWGYSIFMYGGILIFTLLLVLSCVEANWTNYVFCTVGGYAVHHLTSTVNALIDSILSVENVVVEFKMPYILIHILVVVVIYTIIYLFFSKNENIQMIMNQRQIVLLASIVIALNIAISSLGMLSTIYNNQMIFYLVSDLYSLATSILVVFILFGTLEKGHLQNEVHIMNELYKENVRIYEISKATMASLHDMKHMIHTIMDDKYDFSEADRKAINDRILLFDSLVKTGNETLDIIVTKNMLLCHQKNIEFGCIADGARLDFMNVHDIYFLFGNGISNAVEAVCRQSEDMARMIFLSVKATEKNLAIHLENTFSGKITLEDGIPVTNKDDKNFHGFGIKSMRNITEKYGGILTITVEEDLFNLDILFMI